MRFVGFCILMLIAHALWATESVDWLTFAGYSNFVKGESVHKNQWQPLDDYWQKTSGEFAVCLNDRNECNNFQLTALSNEINVLKNKTTSEQLRSLNRLVNNNINGVFEGSWRDSLNFTNEPSLSASKAMMKYFLLRELGFNVENLRVLTVQNRLTNIKESFVVVKLDKPYFLSDQFNTVLPQSKIIDLFIPSYTFNEEKLWMYVPNIENVKEPVNDQ